MRKRLVIYGSGGFGREVLRHARHAMRQRPDVEQLVFASDDPEIIGTTVGGLDVIGCRDFRVDDLCVVAVNKAGFRRQMVQRCPGFFSAIAETAIVYDGVEIGPGAIIADYAILTSDSDTKIGKHFQINTHSTVGHDCTIGDFVTVGPKASINGNVILEDDVYVGCGAHIINGVPGRPLVIGRGAIVGMGAVVTKDVAAGATVVGNPARPLMAKMAAHG